MFVFGAYLIFMIRKYLYDYYLIFIYDIYVNKLLFFTCYLYYLCWIFMVKYILVE